MTDVAHGALFSILSTRPLLVARFAVMQRMVSWSVNRPGFVDADMVAWLEVRNGDLPADLDVDGWFRARLDAAGLGAAVGLITSRNIDRHHAVRRTVEGVTAASLVTLGLNNGERVGARFPPPTGPLAGTVNILVAVDIPLSDAALLEATSIVVEARTCAILEAGFRRVGCDEPVSGTGTDCVVMSAPAAGKTAPYAGKHTAAGEAIGAAVLAATRAAAVEWLSDPGRLVS